MVYFADYWIDVTWSYWEFSRLVKGNFEIRCLENFYIDDYLDNAEGNTYRKTSPFGRYFETCYSNSIAKFPEQ